MTSPIPTIVNLDFARLELFEDYLISTIHEGVVFNLEHLEKFYQIFDSHYCNKPFGYISNRKFDYTVDPTCYLMEYQYPKLVGISILCHSESTFNTAQFEKTFYKRPFEVFYKIENCKKWIYGHISTFEKEKAGL